MGSPSSGQTRPRQTAGRSEDTISPAAVPVPSRPDTTVTKPVPVQTSENCVALEKRRRTVVSLPVASHVRHTITGSRGISPGHGPATTTKKIIFVQNSLTFTRLCPIVPPCGTEPSAQTDNTAGIRVPGRCAPPAEHICQTISMTRRKHETCRAEKRHLLGWRN